ncbi:MAG: hypothetical protein K2M23_02790 [Alphaproteobacteria bacterium]|nr:hypothetical protein [Alphaproteobacteria bacterium]
MTWKNLVKWVIGLHSDKVRYEETPYSQNRGFINIKGDLYFYSNGEILNGWGETIATNRSNNQMKKIIESLL